MADAGTIVGIIVGVMVALFIIQLIFKGIVIVRERQAVVVERFGAFGDLLQPGAHRGMLFALLHISFWYLFDRKQSILPVSMEVRLLYAFLAKRRFRRVH